MSYLRKKIPLHYLTTLITSHYSPLCWKFWCLPETWTVTASIRNQFEQNHVKHTIECLTTRYRYWTWWSLTQNVPKGGGNKNYAKKRKFKQSHEGCLMRIPYILARSPEKERACHCQKICHWVLTSTTSIISAYKHCIHLRSIHHSDLKWTLTHARQCYKVKWLNFYNKICYGWTKFWTFKKAAYGGGQ